jgi:peptidoglycan/xylan/chitin deacetylase (PgdA/CDA1 family)
MTGERSAILTYHSLDESGSQISMSPDLFRRQMEFLASSSISVVPLEEVLERSGSVAITFDDGFLNFLDYAAPVLESLHLPATVFLVSGYCGGRNNWPSQPAGALDLPLMGWRELASLPPWISVGAHSVTHPHLTRLTEAECELELSICRNDIEQHLGRHIRCLAYPYGSRSAKVITAAGRHFDFAVSTSLRFLSGRSSPLDLPRIDAYYLRGRLSLEQLFQPMGVLYVGVRNALRNARRLYSN